MIIVMDEGINLGNFRVISHSHYYDRNLFLISTIIIEDDGDFFYIEKEFDRIKDVTNMPIYISKDWIKYNKKDLNIATLNKQIKWFENQLEDKADNKTEETIGIISVLKSLRRELIIKGII
jgi:hypothetical protein